MARKARIYIPNVSVHVIHRGNNRCTIYRDDFDRLVFLEILKSAVLDHSTDIHGLVLMDTHFHALVTPHTETALPNTMKQLGEEYVRYFNRKYDRIGTLWTGRHRAIPILTELYWLTCLRYIEQNPVRAEMVRAPDQYRWSTYRGHAHGEGWDWIVEHHVYTGLGRCADERQKAYRAICGAQLTDEELAAQRMPSRNRTPSPLRPQSDPDHTSQSETASRKDVSGSRVGTNSCAT